MFGKDISKTIEAISESEPVEIETPKRTNKVSDVCDALSDSISLDMFLNGVEKHSELSKKQYYSRLHRLKETGLVRKYKGHYEMTSTGLVVKRALSLMERAVNYKMNIALRFYDTIRTDNKTIPFEEAADKLFYDDVEIRDIVLNEKRVNVATESEMVDIAMYDDP